MTSARWTFAGHRWDDPVLEVYLITGGHPDRWLPALNTWLATPTPRFETPPRATPPSRNRKKAGLPPRVYRPLEPAIARLLTTLTPAPHNAIVEDDGEVRGFMINRLYGQLPATDYTYFLYAMPATVTIKNTAIQETINLDREAAWTYLYKQAEGDPEATAALDTEKFLAGLIEGNG